MNSIGSEKLTNKMAEMKVSKAELANELGIHKSTLYRKLDNNGEDFTVAEANKIVEVLELNKDEAISIFFAHIVA